MKVLLTFLAIVCISQVFGQSDPIVPELGIESIICLIRELRAIEARQPEIIAPLAEIISILENLLGGYRSCQAIIQNDPPTRQEEIQHQACMARLTAQAGGDVMRIRRIVNDELANTVAIRDGIIAAFEGCLGISWD